MQAELAAARLNLAEMRLARKDVIAAEGQQRKTITKLITYQAFVGATPQDNVKLEVWFSKKISSDFDSFLLHQFQVKLAGKRDKLAKEREELANYLETIKKLEVS